MKRLFAIILVLLCTLSLFGCHTPKEAEDGSSGGASAEITEPMSEHNTEESASSSEEDGSSQTPEMDVVIFENGCWYVVLPISKQKLEIRQRQYAEYVDFDMLKAAEEKVTEQLSQHGESADMLYLYIHNRQLLLCAEVIVDLEKPSGMTPEEEEYWIDHEHKFFSEPITPKIPVE